MSPQLQNLIETAQQLSPLEQVELLNALSRSLSQRYPSSPVDFWNPLDLDQLLQAQPGPLVADMASLATSCWPEQESADEFIEYIYQQRREESLKA